MDFGISWPQSVKKMFLIYSYNHEILTAQVLVKFVNILDKVDGLAKIVQSYFCSTDDVAGTLTLERKCCRVEFSCKEVLQSPYTYFLLRSNNWWTSECVPDFRSKKALCCADIEGNLFVEAIVAIKIAKDKNEKD